MEIEELFCKRYPEYSVNGKPLHPYFDIFEEGYEQAEKENAELKEELKDANEKVVHLACNQNKDLKYKLARAKDIILKLYNAGRDVLMCRAEEKAYDNLDNAINDKSIEQFLKEIEK